MNSHDSHEHDKLSPGESKFRTARFDEGDVLAFVEGQLDAARADEMRAALDRHPEVRVMVDAMRTQRRILASFGDEQAPRELMGRVGDALKAAPETIVIARQPGVVHVRPNPLRIFVESRIGRRMAAAAALLLVAGIGIMLIGRVIERTPIGETRSGFDVPLAMNETPATPTTSTAMTSVVDDQNAADQPALAKDLIEDSAAGPTDVPVLAAAQPITPERAAELALEGRLALRVIGQDDRAASALARIAEQSDGSGTWRVRADVPRSIVAALAPRPTPVDVERGPALADDDGSGNAFLIERSNDQTPPVVYLLESAATPEALAGALEALSARVHAPVEFVELDSPIETPAVVDARSVLWWNTPIDEWGVRIAVPVIVERSDR